MKILFVVHQFPPRFSTGTELYALNLAQALRASGHPTSVLSADPRTGEGYRYREYTETCQGIPVRTVYSTPSLYPNRVLAEYERPFLGQRFAQLLEREGFDLVHFFHFRNLGVSLLRRAWLRGIPCVVHLMDFWTVCPRVTLLRPSGVSCPGPDEIEECIRCMRGDPSTGYHELGRALDDLRLSPDDLSHLEPDDLAIRNEHSLPALAAAARARPASVRESLALADALISPSLYLRSTMVRNGFREESIRILGYAVGDHLRPVVRTKGPGGLRFGFIGSLATHKGVHVLIEAFRRLAWREARLTIYGDPAAHPVYAGELRELARPDPRIRFAGAFSQQELPRVHSEIDVLVAPSLWAENTPFVVLEARAASIPVLATRVGGIEEIVEDGRDGFLFERDDSADLTERLRRFRDDDSLWSRLHQGIRPVKRMSEHIGEVLSLYEEVRSGRGAIPPA